MLKRIPVKIGEVFNRLTVLEDTGKKLAKRGRILLCQCQCGIKIEVVAGDLRASNTKSCGCLKQDTARLNGNKTRKHGHAGPFDKSPEYWTWLKIKQRCGNPNDPSYSNYGAKGIRVYEGWINDFEAFYKEIGPRPPDKTQIDRIDGTKGYEPNNVRWVTSAENNRNRLNNHKVTIGGVTKCIYEWIREIGIAKTTVYNRINNGWSEEEALVTPTKGRGIGSRGKRDILSKLAHGAR